VKGEAQGISAIVANILRVIIDEAERISSQRSLKLKVRMYRGEDLNAVMR
jgi:hypothetical protein